MNTPGRFLYITLKAAMCSYLMFAAYRAFGAQQWGWTIFDLVVAGYFTWSTFHILKKHDSATSPET